MASLLTAARVKGQSGGFSEYEATPDPSFLHPKERSRGWPPPFLYGSCFLGFETLWPNLLYRVYLSWQQLVLFKDLTMLLLIIDFFPFQIHVYWAGEEEGGVNLWTRIEQVRVLVWQSNDICFNPLCLKQTSVSSLNKNGYRFHSGKTFS